jgi:nucleoid-associated protein YgaU
MTSLKAGTAALTHAVLHVDGKPTTEGVTFQFNPTSITLSHSPSLDERGAPKAATNEAQMTVQSDGGDSVAPQLVIEKLGRTSFKLSQLTFDGLKTQENCAKLLTWSYAYEDDETAKLAMTPLVFAWGDFAFGPRTKSAIPVILTKADVTWDRFTARGKPIRAKVSLELQPKAQNPMTQNPTSGGRPGRREHVVVAGERLPGIAAATYGQPEDWRRLAELNSIDDPLRVRPGASLYLPGRTELRTVPE